jgi:condensin complex subunit 1
MGPPFANLCLHHGAHPVWHDHLSLPNKFPKQRQRITELTARSLEDKTSSVRKHSIQLLCKLVETHPFGALHGGTLNLAEWQERYEKVAEELKVIDLKEMEKAREVTGMADDAEQRESSVDPKEENVKEEKEGDEPVADDRVGAPDGAEPASQRQDREQSLVPDLQAISQEQAAMNPDAIVRLRMTKKYYSDALNFIQQIEGAIPTLSQLLVSTTKSEVLESMRFFRTAYEYNFESAEVT